jgi:two-component system alkaline phosphatase synthesis response regulator PhoP
MAKILIIEDETDTIELLRATLEMEGHETVAVTTGEEGVIAATRESPDLIVMDVSLLGALDGLAATRRLRADERFFADADHRPDRSRDARRP